MIKISEEYHIDKGIRGWYRLYHSVCGASGCVLSFHPEMDIYTYNHGCDCCGANTKVELKNKFRFVVESFSA